MTPNLTEITRLFALLDVAIEEAIQDSVFRQHALRHLEHAAQDVNHGLTRDRELAQIAEDRREENRR